MVKTGPHHRHNVVRAFTFRQTSLTFYLPSADLVVTGETVQTGRATTNNVRSHHTDPNLLITMRRVRLLLYLGVNYRVHRRRVQVTTLFTSAIRRLIRNVLVTITMFATFRLFRCYIRRLVFLPPFRQIMTFNRGYLRLFRNVAGGGSVFFASFLNSFGIHAVRHASDGHAVRHRFRVTNAKDFFAYDQGLFKSVHHQSRFFHHQGTVVQRRRRLRLVTGR